MTRTPHPRIEYGAGSASLRGTELELRVLNVGVGYHVAVEAFDENGVSPLGAMVALP